MFDALLIVDRSILLPFLTRGEFHLEAALESLDALLNEDAHDPGRWLEQWRRLLACALCLFFREEKDSDFKSKLTTAVSETVSRPFWRGVQIAEVLASCVNQVLGIPIPMNTPLQLESGAVPLDWEGCWKWGGSPHLPFSLELGVLWYLLGHLTKEKAYTEAADRLTHWHLNLLDYHFQPHEGVFLREQDANASQLLFLHFLLFHISALVGRRPDMEYIAQRQLLHYKARNLRGISPSPYLLMIEKYFDQQCEPILASEVCLTQNIEDRATALIGKRSPDWSVLCALHGGNSGLGSVDVGGGIRLVTFGPHVGAFEDCQRFGILAGRTSEHSLTKTGWLSKKDGFVLGGHVTVSGERKKSSGWVQWGEIEASDHWFEVRESLEEQKLHVSVKWLNADEASDVAMVFFVKAPVCVIDDSLRLEPRSLDRYQGEGKVIHFSNQDHTLTISPENKMMRQEVIPLSGEGEFWASDFVFISHFSADHPKNRWTIQVNREF